MPSLLPSVAAAAGEILGELRQRFMSSLPAGGRACEAETGKSHNGQDCQVARLPQEAAKCQCFWIQQNNYCE